jgi:hypothetical protein
LINLDIQLGLGTTRRALKDRRISGTLNFYQRAAA